MDRGVDLILLYGGYKHEYSKQPIVTRYVLRISTTKWRLSLDSFYFIVKYFLLLVFDSSNCFSNN